MFWGITLENGKRYSQTVDCGFHVSMAALEFNAQESDKKKNVSVMIEHNKSEFLLCSLRHGTTVQQNLDLNFIEGEEVTFFINGPGTVHLTGYVLDMDEEDMDDDDDSGSDFELTDGDESMEDNKNKLKRKQTIANIKNAKKFKMQDVDDLSDEDMDDDESDDEESDDNLKALQFKKKGKNNKGDMKQNKNQQAKAGGNKNQTPKTPQNKKQTVANGSETPNTEGMDSTGKKKRRKKRNKNKNKSLSEGDTTIETQVSKIPMDGSKKAENATTAKKADNAATPKSARKIAGGTTVEELAAGNGPMAKKGRFVQIAYVGRLTNNKVFDSSKKDSPLGFRVGDGEVIKGLDLGIEGMKVGGKRKLIIPPHQAYGKKGTGPIPSNSTLQFEIELKSVK